MNLADILRERATSTPNAAAIVEAWRTGRTLDFAEFDRLTARAAGTYRAAGLEPGDSVLILHPVSAELYLALVATLRAGLVAVFLDPSAGISALRRACRLHPPQAFVGSRRAHLLRFLAPEFRAIPAKFTTRSLLHSKLAVPLHDPVARDAADPALISFTTGSTGEPKAALRTHGFLLAQYRALEKNIELLPGEIDLVTMPLFLLANLASGLTSIIPGVDLSAPGRASPERLFNTIRDHHVTRTVASPALLENLADHCLAHGLEIPSLQKIHTGGAPVFPRVLERLHHVAPNAHIEAVYGSTEAEPIARLAYPTPISENRPGLLAGTPVPEIDLRILDPKCWGHPLGHLTPAKFDTLSLPANTIGEVVVHGDHVLESYLDGRGNEETKFRVGQNGVQQIWHRTGDAASLDEHGRLWLEGRCAQVFSEANPLPTLAVEAHASNHASVRRSALIATSNRQRILAVEYARKPSPRDLAELKESLAWADIDDIRRVAQIPVDKRHNAKIDYAALRKNLDLK